MHPTKNYLFYVASPIQIVTLKHEAIIVTFEIQCRISHIVVVLKKLLSPFQDIRIKKVKTFGTPAVISPIICKNM